MKIVAWFVVVSFVLQSLTEPFDIGKERKPRAAADYVFNLVINSFCAVLAGRILGWW